MTDKSQIRTFYITTTLWLGEYSYSLYPLFFKLSATLPPLFSNNIYNYALSDTADSGLLSYYVQSSSQNHPSPLYMSS
jgi:hypothetical protein